MSESIRLVPVERPAQGTAPARIRIEMRWRRKPRDTRETLIPYPGWEARMPELRPCLEHLRGLDGLAVTGEGPEFTIQQIDLLPTDVKRVLRFPEVFEDDIMLRFQGAATSPELVIKASYRIPGARAFDTLQRTGMLLKSQDGAMARLLPSVSMLLDGLDRIARLPPSRARNDATWRKMESVLGEDAARLFETRKIGIRQASRIGTRLIALEDGSVQPRPLLLKHDGKPLLTQKGDDAVVAEVDDPSFTSVRPTCVYGDYVVVFDEGVRSVLDEIRLVRLLPPEARPLDAFLEGDGTPSLVTGASEAFGDQVVSYGRWKRPDLGFAHRFRAPSIPEWFIASVGEQVLGFAPGDASSLGSRVEDAAAAGETTVRIGGEDLALDIARAAAEVIEGQVEPFRDQITYLNLDGRGLDAANDPDGESAWRPNDPDNLPKAQKVAAEMGLLNRVNITEVQYRAPIRPLIPGLQWVGAYEAIKDFLLTEPAAHQIAELEWMAACHASGMPGRLFCDEQGLGKTLAVLMYMTWLVHVVRPGRPIMVVVPNDLQDVWQSQALLHLKPAALGRPFLALGTPFSNLTPAQRETQFLHMNDYKWAVTTHQNFKAQSFQFCQVRFAALLIDEAQAMKNPGTRLRNAVYGAIADFKLCITGTPVENCIEEAWSLVDLVHPGYLGSLRDFVRDGYEGKLPRAGFIEELSESLLRPSGPGALPFVWRHLKSSVLTGLPAKRRHPARVPMPSVQEEAYARALEAYLRHGGRRRGGYLALMNRLLGICLHPLPPEALPRHPTDAEAVAWLRLSAWTSYALDVALDCKRRGIKMIVACESLDFQPLFSRALAAALGLAEQIPCLNGRKTLRERRAILAAFKEDAGQGFLILTPRVGGVGHTITQATCVLHLTRWPNPAVEAQVEDRTHRIGQTQVVDVHVPMAVYGPAPHRSIDLALDLLMENKRAMAETLLVPSYMGDEAEILTMQMALAA